MVVEAKADGMTPIRELPMSPEQLVSVIRFTMEDHQRLLRESDVVDICPTRELCFDLSDRVRCGPCAIKQAAKFGVETDASLPFAPEQYRLQRRLKAVQAEAVSFCNALETLVSGHKESSEVSAALTDAVKAVVDRYRSLLAVEIAGDGKRR